jgi:uncharacterized protein YodC (DUF2158 family)
MPSRSSSRYCFLLGLACCLCAAACGRNGVSESGGGITVKTDKGSSTTWTYNGSNAKVTPENADKVTIGMKEEQVRDILGRPMHVSEQQSDGKQFRVCVWQNGRGSIAVTFENGQVQSKVASFE